MAVPRTLWDRIHLDPLYKPLEGIRKGFLLEYALNPKPWKLLQFFEKLSNPTSCEAASGSSGS